MKRLWAALGFLTILPLPAACRHSEDDLVQSVPFFPLVGLLIGLSAMGIAAGLEGILPPLVLSVMLVLWLAAVHGGLHLDGLGDTADGFFGPRSRERILAIMRDSYIGAYGCLAITGSLVLKVAALASFSADHRTKAALLAPLAGRCVMVPMLAFLPCARLDGLAALFCHNRSVWESWLALAVLAITTWFIAHWAGVIAGVLTLAAMAGLALWYRRKIGGITGDTVGAANEIAETTILIVLAAQPLSGLWG